MPPYRPLCRSLCTVLRCREASCSPMRLRNRIVKMQRTRREKPKSVRIGFRMHKESDENAHQRMVRMPKGRRGVRYVDIFREIHRYVYIYTHKSYPMKVGLLLHVGTHDAEREEGQILQHHKGARTTVAHLTLHTHNRDSHTTKIYTQQIFPHDREKKGVTSPYRDARLIGGGCIRTFPSFSCPGAFFGSLPCRPSPRISCGGCLP